MTREQWRNRFDRLPPGLLLSEVAKRLKCTYRLASTWARRLGYEKRNGHLDSWSMDRRRKAWRVPWEKMDWTKTNAQLGRQYNVSREIVRVRREEFDGKWKHTVIHASVEELP